MKVPDGVNTESKRRDTVHVQLRTRHNIMLKGVIEKEREIESKEMTTMHHDGSNALTVQFALFFFCVSILCHLPSVLFLLSEPAVVCALDDERES